VYNGQYEISVTVYGSNDLETWEVMTTETISIYDSKIIVLGKNHWWYVKLTGAITGGSGSSIVDAYLYYKEPA
jgi:hypothetical protein